MKLYDISEIQVGDRVFAPDGGSLAGLEAEVLDVDLSQGHWRDPEDGTFYNKTVLLCRFFKGEKFMDVWMFGETVRKVPAGTLNNKEGTPCE